MLLYTKFIDGLLKQYQLVAADKTDDTRLLSKQQELYAALRDFEPEVALWMYDSVLHRKIPASEYAFNQQVQDEVRNNFQQLIDTDNIDIAIQLYNAFNIRPFHVFFDSPTSETVMSWLRRCELQDEALGTVVFFLEKFPQFTDIVQQRDKSDLLKTFLNNLFIAVCYDQQNAELLVRYCQIMRPFVFRDWLSDPAFRNIATHTLHLLLHCGNARAAITLLPLFNIAGPLVPRQEFRRRLHECLSTVLYKHDPDNLNILAEYATQNNFKFTYGELSYVGQQKFIQAIERALHSKHINQLKEAITCFVLIACNDIETEHIETVLNKKHHNETYFLQFENMVAEHLKGMGLLSKLIDRNPR